MKLKNQVCAGLCALVLGLVSTGCATKYYPDLSQRKIVRQYSSEEVIPNYKLNVREKDQKSIDNILDILENVPDTYQKAVNDYGGTVEIFDGKITDNESMRHLKGKKIRGSEHISNWDNHQASHVPYEKKILIKQNYSHFSPCINLELHEYGHITDSALGNISYKGEFKKIFEDYNRNGIIEFSIGSKYQRDNIREFFAESFAKYYFSDKSRENLEKNYKEIYGYFNNLEKKFTESYNPKRILN